MSRSHRPKPPRGLKGPSGKTLCSCGCGQEVLPPRRSWASKLCVHNYALEHDQGYQRRQVYKRDGGKCAVCGDSHPSRRGAWECDHIVEVVNGGACLGIENLQTLCCPCHKEKTARLAAELARRRRQKVFARELAAQPLLFPDPDFFAPQ